MHNLLNTLSKIDSYDLVALKKSLFFFLYVFSVILKIDFISLLRVNH